MNKRVISADCLASVYSKIPHSFATCVEALLPRNVPPPSIYPTRYSLCNSRKYPYPPPPPHGGQRKFRGEGGSKFPRGWGAASRIGSSSCFPGAPSKIDDQAISYFTINQCCKAKIIVFIDDLLLAVRCTFFTACMIVYVTRLSSGHE